MEHRFNAGIVLPRDHLVGAESTAPRARNAEYRREMLGLYVRVPWSGWGGEYAGSDEYEVGMVIEYQSKLRPPRFRIAFAEERLHDGVTLSWAELLGEAPCMNSGEAKAELIQRDGIALTPQPPGRVPAGKYWDPRAAGWYDRRTQQRMTDLDARAGDRARFKPCMRAAQLPHRTTLMPSVPTRDRYSRLVLELRRRTS